MSGCSVGAVGPTVSGPAGPAGRGAALVAAVLATLAALGGCGEGVPDCVTVDPSCTPRYAPTFTNLYNNTLRDSCGAQSVACHSAAGKKGGLSLESLDVAFTQLTSGGRVVAGDAACSEVVVRAHGTGESYLMPPGAPLPVADRCALEQWIAAGALRDAAVEAAADSSAPAALSSSSPSSSPASPSPSPSPSSPHPASPSPSPE